jgi:hypothetical protein
MQMPQKNAITRVNQQKCVQVKPLHLKKNIFVRANSPSSPSTCPDKIIERVEASSAPRTSNKRAEPRGLMKKDFAQANLPYNWFVCPAKFSQNLKSVVRLLHHLLSPTELSRRKKKFKRIAQKPRNFNQKQFCPSKFYINCIQPILSFKNVLI